MLLCEGTAVVLDVVQPKAQLVLAACDSEWGRGARHQERERSPARDARSMRTQTQARVRLRVHTYVCTYTRTHTCRGTHVCTDSPRSPDEGSAGTRHSHRAETRAVAPHSLLGHGARRATNPMAQGTVSREPGRSQLQPSRRFLPAPSSTEGGRGPLPQGREGSVRTLADLLPEPRRLSALGSQPSPGRERGGGDRGVLPPRRSLRRLAAPAPPSALAPSRRPAHQPPAARLLPADPEDRKLPQLRKCAAPPAAPPAPGGRTLTPHPCRAATRGTPTASRSARC